MCWASTQRFNPLAALDPASPRFFEEASAIAEALVKIEARGDPFFDQSAHSLMPALLIWEVKLARAAGRVPSLEDTRSMLGDLKPPAAAPPARDHGKAEADGERGKEDMMASGDFQLMSLAPASCRRIGPNTASGTNATVSGTLNIRTTAASARESGT